MDVGVLASRGMISDTLERDDKVMLQIMDVRECFVNFNRFGDTDPHTIFLWTFAPVKERGYIMKETNGVPRVEYVRMSHANYNDTRVNTQSGRARLGVNNNLYVNPKSKGTSNKKTKDKKV
ncbi:MAG: hypothetical protein FWH52_01335 [Synergistaceae bacterium]|nr:hypothetical protein [Synergistaceae bacterium]